MNIRKHIYREINKRRLNEGITEEGRPDLNYYAFDWDDNIAFMPTKIIVLTENEDEIGMSTEDFAEHRHQIGVEPFNYKGTTVVGYANNPFRNFRTEGDKRFIIDSMIASPGPSWNDFVECINGGSIFAIITARGHNPETLKEAVLNYIISNHLGINSKVLVENLKKYRGLQTQGMFETVRDLKYDDKELIMDYLDMCKFHPVSFGAGSAASPEEEKNKALQKFIIYCKQQARDLVQDILNKNPNKKLEDISPKFKNDVNMNEPTQDIEEFVSRNVSIGFSDDDPRNIQASSEFLKKEYEKSPVNLYLTKGGTKTKYD